MMRVTNDYKRWRRGGCYVVDCQLNLVTWICQLCSMTNTSEKYERTQQGNLLHCGSPPNPFDDQQLDGRLLYPCHDQQHHATTMIVATKQISLLCSFIFLTGICHGTQLTNPSYKSQLSRAINYHVAHFLRKVDVLLEKFGLWIWFVVLNISLVLSLFVAPANFNIFQSSCL